MQQLSEQEIIRREKLTELNNMGIDAYPAALYPVNSSAQAIKENYKGEETIFFSGLPKRGGGDWGGGNHFEC